MNRLPGHRQGLNLDLDGTAVTVFGRHEGAAVGCNPQLSRQTFLRQRLSSIFGKVRKTKQFLGLTGQGCRYMRARKSNSNNQKV